jgi:hypothetical protein
MTTDMAQSASRTTAPRDHAQRGHTLYGGSFVQRGAPDARGCGGIPFAVTWPAAIAAVILRPAEIRPELRRERWLWLAALEGTRASWQAAYDCEPATTPASAPRPPCSATPSTAPATPLIAPPTSTATS